MRRVSRAKYNASSKTRKDETAAHLGIATAHITSGPSSRGTGTRGRKKRAGCNSMDSSRTIVASNPFDDECHSLSQSPALQQSSHMYPVQRPQSQHQLPPQHHQQQPHHMGGPYSPMPHGMQPMQPHMGMQQHQQQQQHAPQSPYPPPMSQYPHQGPPHIKSQYVGPGAQPPTMHPDHAQGLPMSHMPTRADGSMAMTAHGAPGQMMHMHQHHHQHHHPADHMSDMSSEHGACVACHHMSPPPPMPTQYPGDVSGPPTPMGVSPGIAQRPPHQPPTPNSLVNRVPPVPGGYASGPPPQPPPSGTPNSGYPPPANYSTPPTPGNMMMPNQMDMPQPAQHRQPPPPTQAAQVESNYMNQPQQQQQQQPQQPSIYCAECKQPIYPNDSRIMCRAGCESYYHRHCSGLIELAYEMLLNESFAEWACNWCVSSNRLVPHVRIAPQPDCRLSV